ncbi:hypothetical protein K2W90_00565 [Candidatus Babeliales bacterium]|nr:hypothetical protein [Candidatus Babeliales bacterium]
MKKKVLLLLSIVLFVQSCLFAGSGVVPYIIEGGQIYFLLGYEYYDMKRDIFNDFGGSGPAGIATSAKEAHEETMGVFSGTDDDPDGQFDPAKKVSGVKFFTDKINQDPELLVSRKGPKFLYDYYFVDLSQEVLVLGGRTATVQKLKDTQAALWKKATAGQAWENNWQTYVEGTSPQPRHTTLGSYIEKVEFEWITDADLLKVQNPAIRQAHPKGLAGREVYLYNGKYYSAAFVDNIMNYSITSPKVALADVGPGSKNLTEIIAAIKLKSLKKSLEALKTKLAALAQSLQTLAPTPATVKGPLITGFVWDHITVKNTDGSVKTYQTLGDGSPGDTVITGDCVLRPDGNSKRWNFLEFKSNVGVVVGGVAKKGITHGYNPGVRALDVQAYLPVADVFVISCGVDNVLWTHFDGINPQGDIWVKPDSTVCDKDGNPTATKMAFDPATAGTIDPDSGCATNGTVRYLLSQGKEVIVQRTIERNGPYDQPSSYDLNKPGSAIYTYNKLVKEGRKVIGFFHSSC